MGKKKETLESNVKKVSTTKKKTQVKKESPEIVQKTVGLSLESSISEKKDLSSISIEELISCEKACALVCGKYEVKSRLSGVDNAKFIEFSDYHFQIIKEMEKRILDIFSKR